MLLVRPYLISKRRKDLSPSLTHSTLITSPTHSCVKTCHAATPQSGPCEKWGGGYLCVFVFVCLYASFVSSGASFT